MKNKIGVKLTASYIVIILVATLILGLFFAAAARRFLFAEKQRELVRKGQQLGQTVIGLFTGEMPPETAEKILEVTGNYLEARIIIMDASGRRLAMTPGLGWRWARLSRADFSQVISGRTIVRRGYNPILEVEAIFVGTPVKTQTGQITGAVFLIAPLTIVGRVINGLWQLVALASLIGIVIALLVALYLSQSISTPIIKLKEAAVAMAEGNFRIRVGHRSDEIGELAEAFNVMSHRLGQSIEALRREKHKSERMLAELSEGVLAVDEKRRIMFINEKARELLGLKPVTATGSAQDPAAGGEPDLLTMESFPDLRGLINTVAERKTSESAEINLQEKVTVLVHATPLLDGDLLWGIILVFQDISALRNLEMMRKQLIADLSHELRAPLTIIRGQTEALLDGVIEEEATKQTYLLNILEETLRLSKMVRDLLEIAHLDRGALVLQKQDFCLKSLVASLSEKYRPIAGEKKIKLAADFQTAQDHLIVHADPARIEQVIRNLLDNAVRFTPPGGQVLIRLQKQENAATVEVCDTGPGIPKEEQPLIWERFYKVNKARTAGEGGVGLGLAIAKEIVRSSGGQIWVKSEEGKGAIFGFSLPIIKQKA